MNNNKKIIRNVILGVLSFFMLCATAFIALNYHTVRDYIRSLSYKPTAEVAQIEEQLNLTRKGELIFQASYPQLNNKDDFNINCDSHNIDLTVLGCFTNDEIFVYNIRLVDLNGITQSTMAHELLHAVWARMSNADREKLYEDLDTVYNTHLDLFEEAMSTYAEESRHNEIFARAGTELKELPERLELLYARYFKDQDSIVDYYNQYSSTFNKLKARAEELKTQIDELQAVLDSEISDYSTRANALSSDIVAFNACADQTGCFENSSAFWTRRNQLSAEQAALQQLYSKIQSDITAYNSLIEEYNKNATQTNSLNNAINSNSLPEV